MHPRPQIDCIAGIPMTQDEKLFFKQLGVRIAELRKTHGLTQVQLAEALKLTQQMVASYEVGRKHSRIPVIPKVS